MEQQKFQEEEEIDLIELFNALWAQKIKIVKYGVIAGIIGIIVSLSIPKVYTCSATIVPEMEAKSMSAGSLGSLASLAGINLGGNLIGITAGTYPQIITSVPFMFEFADMPVSIEKDDEIIDMTLIEYFTEEYKSPWWSHVIAFPFKVLGWTISLFVEEEDEVEKDINDINIKRLTKDQERYKKMFSQLVSLTLDTKTLTGTLVVNTQSPEITLQLSDSILEKLQEYMTFYKTSKVRSELNSNKNMLREAQKNYYRADSIYAAASDRQRNVTSNVARISLDRLENEKNMTYQIYSQIAAQVELNKTKLNAETPILTVIDPAILPIRASSPNKIMIIIAFGFMGGVVAAAPTLLAVVMGKKEEESENEKN